MGSGRLSVMIDGVIMKLELCAGNWDLLKIQEVSYLEFVLIKTCECLIYAQYNTLRIINS